MSEYTKAYLTLLPQFIILIPAAVLCYMPMKSRLRFSLKKTVIYCLAIFAPYAALSAGACLIWKLDMNIILIPSLALLFLFYRRSVRAGLSCSLSIFLGVCTLMTFPSQFAYAFDAWLHPDSGSANFSIEAGAVPAGNVLCISGCVCSTLHKSVLQACRKAFRHRSVVFPYGCALYSVSAEFLNDSILLSNAFCRQNLPVILGFGIGHAAVVCASARYFLSHRQLHA